MKATSAKLEGSCGEQEGGELMGEESGKGVFMKLQEAEGSHTAGGYVGHSFS